MSFEGKTPKEFTNESELKEFCNDKWGSYIQTLSEKEIHLLLTPQSHYLIQNNPQDQVAINEYKKQMKLFPKIGSDEIVLYRGGGMHFDNRRFLSTSFFKKTAERFAGDNKKNLHKIIIKANAVIIPTLWLDPSISFYEQEAIIDASYLHKQKNIYEYFE